MTDGPSCSFCGAPVLLVDATLELLDAAIEDEVRLGELLGATVAEGWADFPEVLPRLRNALRQGGIAHGWGTILFVLQDPRTLVGFGGYKGAPSEEGVVEIGCTVAPAFRRQGIASEVVRQLLARAFAEPRVRAVIAHTLAEPNPATRVLEKAGFQRIGERADPERGTIWHWRLERLRQGQ